MRTIRYHNPNYSLPRREELPGHPTLFLIHIPKTGGTSTRMAMQQVGGNHGAFNHHKASKLLQVCREAREKNCFAILRDPAERALSIREWAAQIHTYRPFGETPSHQAFAQLIQATTESSFFEHAYFPGLMEICHHFTPQTNYLDLPNLILVRHGHLQEDLDELVSRFGGPEIILPDKRLNSTDRGKPEDLSSSARRRIEEFYAEDFAIFAKLQAFTGPATLAELSEA